MWELAYVDAAFAAPDRDPKRQLVFSDGSSATPGTSLARCEGRRFNQFGVNSRE